MEIGLSEPKALLRGNVLIVVEGGMVEAVCAEPVIRLLAEQADGQYSLAVCQRYADLYAGHPAVKCAIYDEEETDSRRFRTILRLPAPAEKVTFRQRVWAYAKQARTALGEDHPAIVLTGYDLIRAQRFGICALKKPRVAVAVNHSLSPTQWADWRKFCEGLEYQSDCTVIVLGETKTELPAAKNLSGRLTARETAVILSRCDILATTEESYAALALLVQIPAVVMGRFNAPADQKEFDGIMRTKELSPELVLSTMRQGSTRAQ